MPAEIIPVVFTISGTIYDQFDNPLAIVIPISPSFRKGLGEVNV